MSRVEKYGLDPRCTQPFVRTTVGPSRLSSGGRALTSGSSMTLLGPGTWCSSGTAATPDIVPVSSLRVWRRTSQALYAWQLGT